MLVVVGIDVVWMKKKGRKKWEGRLFVVLEG